MSPLLRGVGAALVVVYALAPVGWIVALSVRSPQGLTLQHYRAVLADPVFPAALANSVGIALISTAISVVLGALAAYAIVRLRFPGRTALLGFALATAMFPPVAIVGPLFDLWRILGLYDSWAGLVLPYVGFTLPLAIWALMATLSEVPWDLERAARVDGATRWQALTRVVLPLAAPGLASTAILVFVYAWNDFLYAAALTSTTRARTAPVAIAFFTGASRFEEPTGSIAAASVVVTVPVVLLVLLFQRRIVAGLTAGAVKG